MSKNTERPSDRMIARFYMALLLGAIVFLVVVLAMVVLA